MDTGTSLCNPVSIESNLSLDKLFTGSRAIGTDGKVGARAGHIKTSDHGTPITVGNIVFTAKNGRIQTRALVALSTGNRSTLDIDGVAFAPGNGCAFAH